MYASIQVHGAEAVDDATETTHEYAVVDQEVGDNPRRKEAAELKNPERPERCNKYDEIADDDSHVSPCITSGSSEHPCGAMTRDREACDLAAVGWTESELTQLTEALSELTEAQSETGKRKQSLRGARESHAVNILNEFDLVAETVDILGESAKNLKAVMSESCHNLTLFDLSAVMDEP